MRVALLRDFVEEGWPSMEVYADRLAQGLRALAPEIELIEVRPPAFGLAAGAGRGRALGLYLSRWLRYPLALRRLRADLYHILDNSYGHLAFFLDRRRTLVTSHGGTPRSWRRWNPEGPALWMFDVAFRGALRAARIATVSEYAKRELLAETRYPADRVHVIYHGIEPAFRPPTPAERERLRASLLPAGDRFLILHVGHGAARKNVETLYRAVALLRRQGIAARLLRVGGEPTPAQAQLIAELGLEPAVTHLAHVPNRELPAYYGAADVFAFPSLYEGFGIPLIEAMACGAPVVCSDWELFREVCGDAAELTDARRPELLAAALGRVLSDAAWAGELRRRGLERVTYFTWERCARRTLEVYAQMAAEVS
jgi:glycosyltransferase involved in cell wall biosynthesis